MTEEDQEEGVAEERREGGVKKASKIKKTAPLIP